MDLETLKDIAPIVSSAVLAASAISGFILFAHRTIGSSKKRAFEVIDQYHGDRSFHDALGAYKTAIRKIDRSTIAQMEKVTISSDQIDDGQSQYLSDLYFVIDLYNYWSMLAYRKDLHRVTFRKYLAALIVDEIQEGWEILEILDPNGIEFRYLRWLVDWWARTKRKSDFSLHS